MNYTIPATGVIYDLIDLQNAITQKYRLALIHPRDLEGDMKTVFERISIETRKCRDELVEVMEENFELESQAQLPDLLSTIISSKDRKTILAYCANDLREILDVYAEVMADENINQTWKEILSTQYTSLIKLYAHIRQFHDAQ